MISSIDLLKRYNECPVCDWDLIIISSRDETQRIGFEHQLNEMKANKRHFISNEFKFLVISDQKFIEESKTNIKLGSGGSALYLFNHLVQQFGDNYFHNNKSLLIPSGGYSQRLPHYSVLGKLFSNLPINLNNSKDKYWTALDVILALMAPLAQLISSGVWVTSSDAFVIYSYIESELQNLPKLSADSIVCLGHPSSADIAVNHGVYVLDKQELDSIDCKSLSLHNCLKVLQKPTLNELTKFNAFVRREGKEFCITDSSYYLGADIIGNKFLKFPLKSIDTEIDCYGHFLCPLGSEPITKEVDSRFNSPLNDILIGSKFNVLFITHSKFIHLGTIGEYMYEMTEYKDKEFANSLCFKGPDIHKSIEGTVICSEVNPNSKIDSKSVIEFCNFKDIVIETDNNLLYNCWVQKSTDISLPVIKFPPNYLIYSLPITIDGVRGWCTLGCHTSSDLKSSLWTDRVFPICETSTQSLMSTLNMINNNVNQKAFTQTKKVSFSDIKDIKNIQIIIEFQNKLKSF